MSSFHITELDAEQISWEGTVGTFDMSTRGLYGSDISSRLTLRNFVAGTSLVVEWVQPTKTDMMLKRRVFKAIDSDVTLILANYVV